jgi:hypothetical protein
MVRWYIFPVVNILFSPVATQKSSTKSGVIHLTVKPGMPIRVALKKSVRIRKVGVPIEGRVLDPVYVFNREVISAGSTVLGSVTKIDPVSRKERLRALANGDLTPFHNAHIEFNTLALRGGMRLPIETAVSPVTTETLSQQDLKEIGSRIPPGSTVHVWLETPLNSAKDHKGSPRRGCCVTASLLQESPVDPP